MDVDPSDAHPEAVKGQEINQENGHSRKEKPQLASAAAMTTNEAPQIDRQPSGDGRPLKRPATGELLQDKPEVKRRNQRLFGALLGTLQKFKKEEDATQSSAAAQRRAAMQQAAEKKSRAASAHYLEKNVQTRLEDNRNGPQQRYTNDGAANDISNRKAPHVPFILMTVTVPSLSWAPRERCPEVDKLLEKQRETRSQDIEIEKIPRTGAEDGNGGGGGSDKEENKAEEGEIEDKKQEPSVIIDEKRDYNGNIIDADADKGPISNKKDEPSDIDDGGGWRVVEDPTAEEAFR